MSLQVGATLGAYKILSVLGAGGMGEVYRAHDARLDREVAIKLLPDAMAKDAGALARFEREARAVAALNHPHIVTLYSTEHDGAVRFLTMELVEGRTLDQMIPPNGLALAQFFDIATALADALQAAHHKHITHGDLKPSNVMVTEDGRIKVLDFGLASADHAEPAETEAGDDTTRQAVTVAGAILGTVPYMSPEQLEGKPTDHRSDLFSLGVVLYEMVTGARPFRGDSAPAVMSAILRDNPLPAIALRPETPADLSRLIARCLEKEARDRTPSAYDVLVAIKGARRAWESGATSPAAPSLFDRRPSRPADLLRVAVLPFASRGGGDAEALADGLTDDITAGLSRFPHLRALARPDVERSRGHGAAATNRAAALGARYLLEGHIRAEGPSVRVTVHVVDSRTGTHLWAETFNRTLGDAGLFAVQDDIAHRVVATVADKTGVLVRAMGEALRDVTNDDCGVTEWVLRFLAAFAQARVEEHAVLRAGFEQALGREPLHAVGWACLAQLYGAEHSLGFNPLPDIGRRQRQAAERAIALDPTCQDGWRELAVAHFYFDRDLTGLRVAAERAVSLNPLDTQVVATVGMLLAYAGDWDRGVALVRQAMAPNPHHPGWFHTTLSAYHYYRHEYEDALTAAKRVNMPAFFPSHLHVAAAAGQLNRRDDARSALDSLGRTAPMFLNLAVTRAYFSRRIWDTQLVEHFAEGFTRAKQLAV
jgi:serine/threonine protein kinase